MGKQDNGVVTAEGYGRHRNLKRALLFAGVALVTVLLRVSVVSGASHIITYVPAYYWYNGCGPTALGMVFGYYDVHGYPDLFPEASGWDQVKITANVKQSIVSDQHKTYFHGTDDGPYADGPKNSIAYWFKTSLDPAVDGASDVMNDTTAIQQYASYRGYTFDAKTVSISALNYNLVWDDPLVPQINDNMPLLAVVNSGGDPDHFVVIVGYDDDYNGTGKKYYACYDTYSETEVETNPESNGLRWEEYRPGSYSWGISRLTWAIPPDGVGPLLVTLASFTASASGDHIELRWQTATEMDNAGFHILRSLAADGAYERVTTALIPAAGGATEGAEYTWTDENVLPWQTYYYKLEDMDDGGKSTLHGPVAAQAVLRGDVTGDGTLDLADAVSALRVVAGGGGAVSVNPGADVDGDLRIGAAEAAFVLRKLSLSEGPVE